MSLRAFHIIFVIVTVVLSLYVVLWGIREYTAERDLAALGMAALFLVAGLGMMIYGKKAFTKLKDLP